MWCLMRPTGEREFKCFSFSFHNVESLVCMFKCNHFPPVLRLFEMGFAEQLEEIIRRLPDTRQTLLFSATLPKLLVEFARAGETRKNHKQTFLFLLEVISVFLPAFMMTEEVLKFSLCYVLS